MFQAPYSLKESDLVCFIDEIGLSSNPAAAAAGGIYAAPMSTINTNTITSRQTIMVSRPEDLILATRKKELKSGKKRVKSRTGRSGGTEYGTGSVGGKKRPVVEVTLTLGGDLDFSDDDEENADQRPDKS